MTAARLTDPDTSHEAAQLPRRIDRDWALIALYTSKGLTDFQLATKMSSMTGRPVAQTSAGKRRGELRDAGLVEYANEKRPAPSGSPSRVWQLTGKGLVEARRILWDGVR